MSVHVPTIYRYRCHRGLVTPFKSQQPRSAFSDGVIANNVVTRNHRDIRVHRANGRMAGARDYPRKFDSKRRRNGSADFPSAKLSRLLPNAT